MRRDDHHRRRRRRGIALLEAIVALTIFSIAIAAALTLASECGAIVDSGERAERDARRASALLGAAALWTRADLDRHLGDRAQGAWRMRITRPSPTIYVISIADSARHVELLRTALYRRDGDGAAP